MDWEKILTQYGPLAIAVWFLWKVHRDIIIKRIPREFKMMRHILREHEQETEERHAQQLEATRIFTKAIKELERAFRVMAFRMRHPNAKPRKRKKTAAK